MISSLILFFRGLDYFCHFSLLSIKGFNQKKKQIIFWRYFILSYKAFPIYKHGLDLSLPKFTLVLFYYFI